MCFVFSFQFKQNCKNIFEKIGKFVYGLDDIKVFLLILLDVIMAFWLLKVVHFVFFRYLLKYLRVIRHDVPYLY